LTKLNEADDEFTMMRYRTNDEKNDKKYREKETHINGDGEICFE